MVVNKVVKMSTTTGALQPPFFDQAQLRASEVQTGTGTGWKQSLMNDVHSVGLDFGRFDLDPVMISTKFVAALDLFYGRICPVNGVLKD